MAVKIRLKRLGKIRAPYYRIVVVDSRAKRDGRVIEEIGKYHPTEDPSFIQIDSERVQYWLSVGAQPTEAVLAQLKLTGDWQKFKDLPYEEGTLKVAQRHISAAETLEAAEAEALKKVSAKAELEAKKRAEAEAAEAKREAEEAAKAKKEAAEAAKAAKEAAKAAQAEAEAAGADAEPPADAEKAE
ncbi:MAG: 30S ribosomal protein S16, partial [Micrococcales bacterium]|nr:30S ribosomal protein S16 [Micrococcales bacterium]